MKKILIITRTSSLDDGQGRYSIDLIERLRKNYKLVILSSDLADAKEKCLKDRNIECHEIPGTSALFNLFYNLLYSWKLLKFFKEVDFIHSFSDYPQCLLPFWFSFLIKKPVFITVHGTYGVLPLDGLKSKLLLKRAYKKAKKVFCVSGFTEKEILKRVNLKNTIVINNGVDYAKFQRSFQKKEKKNKIILSVGALKPRKGYHISIPAVAKVKKKYKDIKYYIVGGKPPKIYLDLVKKHNLENNVKFFQNISDKDLIKLYYEADIFLLTPVTINNNDFEGFGLVYLEAGACGKPAIGTFDCGAEDAIVNNVTGLLMPQNNIQKTTEAVIKLLDNPKLAKKLGENGKKRAQQMSWDNVAKEYIKRYKAS